MTRSENEGNHQKDYEFDGFNPDLMGEGNQPCHRRIRCGIDFRTKDVSGIILVVGTNVIPLTLTEARLIKAMIGGLIDDG